MLRLIRQKIKNQTWLSLCLMLGISLIVAVAACHPMFLGGALDSLLLQLFCDTIDEQNEYPTVLSRSASLTALDGISLQGLSEEIVRHEAIWKKYLSMLPAVEAQTLYALKEYPGRGSWGDKSYYLQVSHMPRIDEHIRIVKGRELGDGKENGAYPCLMSEYVMDRRGLLAGEEITFETLRDEEEKPLRLVVSGIYEPKEDTDLFWRQRPNENEKELFVSEGSFEEILQNYHPVTLSYTHSLMLDYQAFSSENIDEVKYYLDSFAKRDACFSYSFENTLNSYVKKRREIGMMLFVLELPVLGMAFAFLYMVSSRILEAEGAEIMVLKSRGLSGRQIIGMYLLRDLCLALLSLPAGILLGYGLCRLAARATDFLTFCGQQTGTYRFVHSMPVYGSIAAMLSVFFVLLPAFFAAGRSPVEHRAKRQAEKRRLWEKYFLDFLLLLLSLYLLYNFNQTTENLQKKALAGESLDPVLFLNTCLFILSFGLFCFRLIHYLVCFLYKTGKEKWKPVSYAALLQSMRTFQGQGFISVFLILTISLGIFSSGAARTINQNNEERLRYSLGADGFIKEQWGVVSYRDEDGNNQIKYIEPDYNKYARLKTEGLCESYARVVRYEHTNVECGSEKLDDCMVLGIETDAFGNTAYLKEELNNGRHWFHELNQLAQKPGGVIISKNLADTLEIGEGDVLQFYLEKRGEVQKGRKMSSRVAAVVENFPGYDRYYYEDGQQKERYLVVANLVMMFQKLEPTPYEIWLRLKKDKTVDDVKEMLGSQGITICESADLSRQIDGMKASPKVKITNGMFTLSFLIALVLCSVGFLIYWITSIRGRELLFGVYRAMGLSGADINRMLLLEHLFSTLLAVIAGGLVGLVTTFLFIRLTCIVYLPQKSNLDIYIDLEPWDLARLFAALALVITLCLLVLRRLIGKLNITQALKLGED